MSFGRNPYVSKAQAAEQKALDAQDDDTRTRAYRDAAHQWDRAAEREKPGKYRAEYERNAIRNRELADGESRTSEPAGNTAPAKAPFGALVVPTDPRFLN
ncbi:MAG: hypothetical protein IPK82_39500 [Polyangiaceae bacterium]|nr:hypothetical protein [Polyangiaceae bacterium]